MFDIETAFDKMKVYFQKNLNAKIDAINNEKGDQLMARFEENAYAEGSLDQQVLNFDQVCFAYIESMTSTATGPSISKRVVIEIDLLIHQRNDFLDYRRVLRYHRALIETAQGAWGKVGNGYGQAEITSLDPIDIKLFNASFFTKVIGLQIEFTFN